MRSSFVVYVSCMGDLAAHICTPRKIEWEAWEDYAPGTVLACWKQQLSLMALTCVSFVETIVEDGDMEEWMRSTTAGLATAPSECYEATVVERSFVSASLLPDMGARFLRFAQNEAEAPNWGAAEQLEHFGLLITAHYYPFYVLLHLGTVRTYKGGSS